MFQLQRSPRPRGGGEGPGDEGEVERNGRPPGEIEGAKQVSLFGFAILSFCSLVSLVYIRYARDKQTNTWDTFFCPSQWHCVLISSGFPATERDQFYSQLDFQHPVKSFQSHQSCNMSRITKAALQ